MAAAAATAGQGRSPPLQVVTLATPLTEFASRIGGSEARVRGLIPPGVDPHTFEPSPRAVAELAGADLIVSAGPEAETGVLRLVQHAAPAARLVNLWPQPVDADPHWWNSLVETGLVVDRLAAAMQACRAGAPGSFAAGQEALRRELGELEAWSRQNIASISPSRRVLVTNHDAFGLFARDFGFRVVSLSGFNPESEPSARSLAQAETLVRRTRVPCVFLDVGANPRLIEALATDTGARLGGMLYPDGLTAEGEGRTFAGLFRHNVQTLVDGLK